MQGHSPDFILTADVSKKSDEFLKSECIIILSLRFLQKTQYFRKKKGGVLDFLRLLLYTIYCRFY